MFSWLKYWRIPEERKKEISGLAGSIRSRSATPWGSLDWKLIFSDYRIDLVEPFDNFVPAAGRIDLPKSAYFSEQAGEMARSAHALFTPANGYYSERAKERFFAHELGHIVLGQSSTPEEIRKRGYFRNEQEANYFTEQLVGSSSVLKDMCLTTIYNMVKNPIRFPFNLIFHRKQVYGLIDGYYRYDHYDRIQNPKSHWRKFFYGSGKEQVALG